MCVVIVMSLLLVLYLHYYYCYYYILLPLLLILLLLFFGILSILKYSWTGTHWTSTIPPVSCRAWSAATGQPSWPLPEVRAGVRVHCRKNCWIYTRLSVVWPYQSVSQHSSDGFYISQPWRPRQTAPVEQLERDRPAMSVLLMHISDHPSAK